MERIAAHCIKLGCVKLYIPSDLLTPRDLPPEITHSRRYSFQPQCIPPSRQCTYELICTGYISPWYLNSVPVNDVCIVHSLQFAGSWPVHDICISWTVRNLPLIHFYLFPCHDLHTMWLLPFSSRERGLGAVMTVFALGSTSGCKNETGSATHGGAVYTFFRAEKSSQKCWWLSSPAIRLGWTGWVKTQIYHISKSLRKGRCVLNDSQSFDRLMQ